MKKIDFPIFKFPILALIPHWGVYILPIDANLILLFFPYSLENNVKFSMKVKARITIQNIGTTVFYSSEVYINKITSKQTWVFSYIY